MKAGQVQGEEEVEVGVETRGPFPDRWTMEGERGERCGMFPGFWPEHLGRPCSPRTGTLDEDQV